MVSSPSSSRGGHGEEPLDLAVDDDRVQAFLAAEVLVDDGLGDAGLGGDLLDGGAVQAALGEQAPTDVEQLRPALLAGHSPAVARLRTDLSRPHHVG